MAEEGKTKGYGVTLENLAYLYDMKGDFKKAIDTLGRKMTLIEKRGLLKFENWRNEKANIEWKMNELKKKLMPEQK